MKKFVGVAYWSGTLVEGWVEKVFSTLRSVDGLSLSAAETGGIGIGYAGHGITLVDTGGGKTQGLVPESAVAGVFVVCLVALRRVLGDIEVVDDAQAPVPATVRQAYPLYAGCWPEVCHVGEQLGMVAGKTFLARHATVMNRLI